jgi:glycerate kinase
MSLRVLIAPDKFKGTLTAQAAAAAMAKGWHQVRPQDRLTLLPTSDGGDGFGEIISGLLGARIQTMETVDAAHRAHTASWWWHAGSRTAIVESAKIIGLAQLPPKQFHPFELDTAGLGKVLEAAARKGARQCLIGIGGSATNDGGFGLARALGWEFFGRRGEPIETWTGLDALVRVQRPRNWRLFAKTLVAVDVQNRLLGPHGCSRIYGPQKGLRPEDFPHAEKCLGRLARVMARTFGKDHAKEPGTGSAGGFDLFARHAELKKKLRGASLVVTGEGAIDRSTVMGKGVGEIGRRCAKLKIPCLGLGGCVHNPEVVMRVFTAAFGIVPDLTTLEEARAQPEHWLAELARHAAQTV